MEQAVQRQEWCQAALVPEKSTIFFVFWALQPAVTLNVLQKLLAIAFALPCPHHAELELVSVNVFDRL